MHQCRWRLTLIASGYQKGPRADGGDVRDNRSLSKQDPLGIFLGKSRHHILRRTIGAVLLPKIGGMRATRRPAAWRPSGVAITSTDKAGQQLNEPMEIPRAHQPVL